MNENTHTHRSLSQKLIAAPYIVWMIVFIIVPLAMVAYFAMTTADGAFTLENIKNVGQYANIFARSIWLAAIATVICLVIAYPAAYILSRASVSAQSTLLMLVMLPMWMNFLLRTYAWMTILGNNGLINSFLGLFGIEPVKMLNTQGAIVLGMVYNYLPYMILPLYSVMVKIDNMLLEAAQDLGCNSKKVLFKVVLPLSLPGVMSGITMVFVPSVSTFYISQKLGGNKDMLIGDAIEYLFNTGPQYYNVASTLSLILMVLILICTLIMNRFGDDEEVVV